MGVSRKGTTGLLAAAGWRYRQGGAMGGAQAAGSTHATHSMLVVKSSSTTACVSSAPDSSPTP
jgi:cyanophycinase-like exopeptidase